MTTRETIERWVELFNANDPEALSALYAEDAVNHQIALDPVAGRAAIEQFHRETFAAGPLTCTPINLVVDGDWAALEWVDPDGFRGCGFFHVRNGLIEHQRGYWDSAQLRAVHPDVH
ncbi:nuclear transport factor 2 family protein [Mycobacterium sp. CPCC 205372]|uniref:Nuclear transport factor 2 family protein n=1 Tax=Mycobacterium hippophais TaxID=3016340 RepID=A0ABT4PRE0_9MYCO|nr:nuclear transport factor 2 family protein [Mycobacterium hippophais]MCZ8379135.1 nuclear transport factor 2 family protein [Mycobacterium hippophais]